MASKTKSVPGGKGYTPPKGRATVHNTGADRGRRMSAKMEWILAAVVFLVVIVAIFYFGSDFRIPGGGGGQTGAGLPASLAPLIAG